MSRPRHSPKSQRGTFRIIAGQWRGRRLAIPAVAAVRPTTDRIRETLFNWLQPTIIGSRCLDLFAGSGALGFEALSRGAASVTLVDSDPTVIAQLHDHRQRLQASGATIVQSAAHPFLAQQREPFDTIFLDPPFADRALPQLLEQIAATQRLRLGGRIYAESADPLEEQLTPAWQLYRQQRAGGVWYGLIQSTDCA